MTYTNAAGRKFQAKETNGKLFYWSPLAVRWLPAKRSQVSA